MSSGFGEKTLEQGILLRVVDDIAHGDPVPRSGNNFVGPFLSERSADLDGAHAVLGAGHGPLEGFLEAGDRENVSNSCPMSRNANFFFMRTPSGFALAVL